MCGLVKVFGENLVVSGNSNRIDMAGLHCGSGVR